jgi:predicted nucleic acid-binding protein
VAALGSGLFLDTSVLLAGVMELQPPNPAAHAIMGAVADGRLGRPATAFHCCLEFFAVATRLPVEYRVTPQQAELLVCEEILARFEVTDLPRTGHRGLFAVAATEVIAGGRVYDLHIAEVARARGATTVLTQNRRHFTSLLRHGVTVLTAEEFAGRLGHRR